MTFARDGWTAHGNSCDKLSRWFLHNASGLVVAHCGHPTAHQPWYLRTQLGKRVGVLSGSTQKGRPLGLCWPTLSVAFEWVERNVCPSIEFEDGRGITRRFYTVKLPPPPNGRRWVDAGRPAR